MDDPGQIGREFGEVFDLVDEAVGRITGEQIEARLHQLLETTKARLPQLLAEAVEAAEPDDVDELSHGPTPADSGQPATGQRTGDRTADSGQETGQP
jgi:hypothetical protein